MVLWYVWHGLVLFSWWMATFLVLLGPSCLSVDLLFLWWLVGGTFNQKGWRCSSHLILLLLLHRTCVSLFVICQLFCHWVGRDLLSIENLIILVILGSICCLHLLLVLLEALHWLMPIVLSNLVIPPPNLHWYLCWSSILLLLISGSSLLLAT